jgi:hypothetical protein
MANNKRVACERATLIGSRGGAYFRNVFCGAFAEQCSHGEAIKQCARSNLKNSLSARVFYSPFCQMRAAAHTHTHTNHSPGVARDSAALSCEDFNNFYGWLGVGISVMEVSCAPALLCENAHGIPQGSVEQVDYASCTPLCHF